MEHALLVMATTLAIAGWVVFFDERKQKQFLLLKVEGYKNVVLGYMTYRYKDQAKIEKLENELKVCEFGRGKTND